MNIKRQSEVAVKNVSSPTRGVLLYLISKYLIKRIRRQRYERAPIKKTKDFLAPYTFSTSTIKVKKKRIAKISNKPFIVENASFLKPTAFKIRSPLFEIAHRSGAK